MTKSITEKNRIQEIKKYENASIDVPPELLKIKISHISPYYSYRAKNRYDFLKPSFVKEHTYSFLQKNINIFLSKIANNLKIYEFKVQVLIESNLKSKYRNNQKLNLYMMLRLTDNKNRHIGNIVHNKNKSEEEISNGDYYYDNYFITSKAIGCFVNHKKSDNFNTIMHLKNMMKALDINKNEIAILLNNTYFHKNKNIINILKQFDENIKLYNLSKFLKKERKTTILISVSDVIEYILSVRVYVYFMYSEKLNINDYNEINHISHLKKMGLIRIPIDEKELHINNIDEIRTLIKALYY